MHFFNIYIFILTLVCLYWSILPIQLFVLFPPLLARSTCTRTCTYILGASSCLLSSRGNNNRRGTSVRTRVPRTNSEKESSISEFIITLHQLSRASMLLRHREAPALFTFFSFPTRHFHGFYTIKHEYFVCL